MNCAAPEDQYPVDTASVQFRSGVIGQDWCFFGVLGNDTHDNPLAGQQGASYRQAQAVPTADGSTLRITGYGLDDDPQGSTGGFNQYSGTQQTDSGPYQQLRGTEVQYRVDTLGGTSGSAVEHECRRLVYAIHTHGGCESPGGANKGTVITIRSLQDALIPNSIDGGTREPQGVCADCNGNGILDGQDIAGGTSQDCNVNGIPDECEPNEDCQPNGTYDICDIATRTSKDRNGNLIPDECESPVGACCRNDASCLDLRDVCCTEVGGTFVGEGTTCSPVGACCVGDGSCMVVAQVCCSGTFLGTGTSCPLVGQPQGACCLTPDGCCVDDATQSWCQQQGGLFRPGATCPDPPSQFFCPPTEGPGFEP